MSDEMKLLAVHAGCVLTIAACFALAELTPLAKAMPVAARVLEASGFMLWGKLGFKPAEVVVERIIAGMDPARVDALSKRPPPPEQPMGGAA
jgi:hypothetical protein